MSDYFTYVPLTANTVARAADVNARFQGVEAGFALLPPPQYIYEDRQTFAVDEGAPNAYVANPAIPITAYNVGLHIVLQAANSNTGISTLNVSGLGVKEIIRSDSTSLQAGDIIAGQVLDLTYDGEKFQLAMAFADISPAGIAEKISQAGDIVVNGNLSATSITCNGQTIDALTTFGVSLVESVSATAARGVLGLGTMATEAAITYAPINSPALTGVPTAPTAAPGTNTTQLATTAFCSALGALYLPISGGTLTGDLIRGQTVIKTGLITMGNGTYFPGLSFLGAGSTEIGAIWGPTDADHTIYLEADNFVFSNVAENETYAVVTANGVEVPDQIYSASWNGNMTVPTKNAVYDKIEAMAGGGGMPTTGGTFTGDISVPDEAYGIAWNQSIEVPTKNAIYDKIEAIVAGGGGVVTFNGRSGTVVLTAADVTTAHPALTGDVTTVAGAVATTIAANAVTLAKMADVATSRFLGRVTAGTGDPEALTGTQATTLLDTFTSALKGVVPASGGGTTNFLRADGVWTAPPGGGGGGAVSSFNTRTGDIVLTGADVTTALTYTPSAPGHTHAAADITSGTLAAARMPAYTGDVTTTAGAVANTIAAGAVTYAKMQNSAAGNVILCRAAAAAGVYAELPIAASRLVGRGSTGDIAAISLGASLSFSGAVLSVASTPTTLTFSTTGGAGAPATWNGSVARTIDYSTVGALPMTPRVQSAASGATLTPTFDDDICIRTAQAASLTLANWSGTAVPNHGMAIRIKDNGTARAIGYGTQYRAIGVTLPTTTVISKTLYLGCIWNATDSKIDVVSVAQEA